MTACGLCGNTQGPFDRVFVGNRKTGQWVVSCRVDRKASPEVRAKQARDCYRRGQPDDEDE